jgi:hypothetical protein
VHRRARRTLVALVVATGALASASGPAVVSNLAGITGTPYVGARGITESVGALNVADRRGGPGGARAKNESHAEKDPLRQFLRNESSSPVAARTGRNNARASGAANGGSGAAAAAASTPQTPGTSWTAVQGWGAAEAPYSPPDSQGAAGPTQFLVVTNGRVKTFDKTTGLADGALNTTADAFFASVRSDVTTDPRVRYDRLSGRWFVAMIDIHDAPNRVLLAVSSGDTITSASSFTFFQFRQDTPLPAGDPSCFSDYETLGIDANALYIGVNNFCGVSQNFTNTDAFVVRKSALLTGSLVVTAFRDIIDNSGGAAGPNTPQGVDNDDPSATTGYFIGVDNSSFGKLDMRRVTDPGGTPALSANIPLTVASTRYPRPVPALGSTHPLDPLDDRLFYATMRGGHIWTSHNVGVLANGTSPISGTPDRTGARWYDIASPDATPAVAQTGTVFDNAASSPRSFWIPALNVSGQGHMAIGFSSAGATHHADAGVAGRLASDALGAIGAPQYLTASASAYNAQTSATQRWGDYSQVSVDPEDNMTMWNVQEFTAPPTSGTSTWGVRVTKLVAPPPATLAANSACALTGLASTNVVLNGTSTNGSAFYDPGAAFPNHLAVTAAGGIVVNSVTYDNPTTITLDVDTTGIPTGTYDIAVTNPDGQQTSAQDALAIRSSGDCEAPANGVVTAPATGVWGTDNTLAMSWTAATDNVAVAGYSHAFTHGSTFPALDSTADCNAACLGTTSAALGDGTWYFHVRALDTAGNAAPVQSFGPFLVDAHRPTAVAMTRPASSQRFQRGRTFAASWTSNAAPSGAHHYNLQFRSAQFNGTFAGYSPVSGLSPTTRTSSNVTGDYGATYCLRAIATDNASNPAAVGAPKCTTIPLRATQLSNATSGWSSGSGSSYFGSAFKTTTRRGAELRRANAYRVRHLDVVATTCSTCGYVDVYIGSFHVGRANLASSSTRHKVLKAFTLSSARSGTVRLLVTSANGKRVTVEGLGLTQL